MATVARQQADTGESQKSAVEQSYPTRLFWRFFAMPIKGGSMLVKKLEPLVAEECNTRLIPLWDISKDKLERANQHG
jgi:hypothetical protein